MQRLLGIWALASLAASVSEASVSEVSLRDLHRAKTKKPRDAFRGSSQAEMSKTLNEHLRRAHSKTRPCDAWSLVELQDFMATVLGHRSHDLQQIYAMAVDRRSLPKALEEVRLQWAKTNSIVQRRSHLLVPQREAHCREAVMWWVHHLSAEKRSQLERNLTVPLLPEGPKSRCKSESGRPRMLGTDGNSSRKEEGESEESEESHVCARVNEANSCDWCHSTQADHDKGLPGTSPPDATKKFTGPDDGNPQGWNRTRRCDQDQMPQCQLCEGVGGMAYGDANDKIIPTPCQPIANASQVDMKTVAKPLYPKKFTIRRKDGKQGGYSDTLIGWKTDPFCFGFFPQNDSTKPMCYRSEDAYVKYYDIEREAERAEYTIHNGGLFAAFPNITSVILHVNEQMWIQNDLWGIKQCICANPSGNHCTNPPCKAYVQHWDTFASAQYLGRERIGAEWIQDHGVGESAKMMELDHFILWSHHVWTDPKSRRLVRAWKPFNGLQLYDPEAWVDDVQDPSVFDSPPLMCKKGHGSVRINCDDEGNYHPKKMDNEHILESLLQRAASHGPEGISKFAADLRVSSTVVV